MDNETTVIDSNTLAENETAPINEPLSPDVTVTEEAPKKKKIIRRKRKTKSSQETTEDDDEEDYIDEDPDIPGQMWACVSVFTPNSVKTPEGQVVKKHNIHAMKIRGVYSTQEKAKKRVEEINAYDTKFNIFIAPVGKWLPWDDDAKNAEEAVYADKKLNEMMKAYDEEQKKSKDYIEQRKLHAAAQSKKYKKAHDKQQKKKMASNNPEGLDADDVAKTLIQDSIPEHVEKKVEEIESEIEQLKLDAQSIDTSVKTSADRVNEFDKELDSARKLMEEMTKNHVNSGIDIVDYQSRMRK
jgi:hypothetical protein